jgi:DNA-binding winged helix-turn-helix (wHTH) protein
MGEVYRFDRFVLDPKKRTLLWERLPVPLTPKAFDILLFFLRAVARD